MPDTSADTSASFVESTDLLFQFQSRIQELEHEREQILQTNLQHLHELAVLNHMTDLLGQRRSYRTTLIDALRESVRLTKADRGWVIEASAEGEPAAVHTRSPNPDASELSFEDLPEPARQLYHQAVALRGTSPASCHDLDDEGGFTAFPIASAKHLMAVLVLHADDVRRLEDDHAGRLLRSVLRQTAIACENARLAEVMAQMVVETVLTMGLAIESRDPYTGGHTQRVTAYALLLGRQIGLDPASLTVLQLGGLLHDIGKIAVPDAILHKPGRLTEEEFSIIKQHPSVGHDIVRPIPQLECTTSIVRHHHERWDGQGYPDRLGGRDIPYFARIMAVADTFDAMTSDRPYRRGLPFGNAIDEIRVCAGTQFDPDLADAFLSLTPDQLDEAARSGDEVGRGLGTTSPADLLRLLDLRLPYLEPDQQAPLHNA